MGKNIRRGLRVETILKSDEVGESRKGSANIPPEKTKRERGKKVSGLVFREILKAQSTPSGGNQKEEHWERTFAVTGSQYLRVEKKKRKKKRGGFCSGPSHQKRDEIDRHGHPK